MSAGASYFPPWTTEFAVQTMELTEGRSRFSFARHRRSKRATTPQDDHILTTSKEKTPGAWRALSRDLHLSSVNEQTAELLETTNHTLAQPREAQRLR